MSSIDVLFASCVSPYTIHAVEADATDGVVEQVVLVGTQTVDDVVARVGCDVAAQEFPYVPVLDGRVCYGIPSLPNYPALSAPPHRPW